MAKHTEVGQNPGLSSSTQTGRKYVPKWASKKGQQLTIIRKTWITHYIPFNPRKTPLNKTQKPKTTNPNEKSQKPGERLRWPRLFRPLLPGLLRFLRLQAPEDHFVEARDLKFTEAHLLAAASSSKYLKWDASYSLEPSNISQKASPATITNKLFSLRSPRRIAGLLDITFQNQL